MCLMGDVFGGYMLYYISWDWIVAFGLVFIVTFTGVSGLVLCCTVCCYQRSTGAGFFGSGCNRNYDGLRVPKQLPKLSIQF